MATLTEGQKRKRDEIAETLKRDPEFQPQEGRTKEESAFAVATAQVEGNPEQHGGNPMDENLRATILQQAANLRASGDPELEAKGLVLEVATARGDVNAMRKTLSDLARMAKEEELEWAADVYGYLRDSLEKEGEG